MNTIVDAHYDKLSRLHATITITQTEIILLVHKYFLETTPEVYKDQLKTAIQSLTADLSAAQTSYLSVYHSLLLNMAIKTPTEDTFLDLD